MKKNKFSDLSILELENRERELRNEFVILSLKKNVGQTTKPSKFTELRRDIARIITVKQRSLIEK